MMSERPLKILHVTPYFHPAWAYGGIPRIACDIAREEVRQGHDVSAVTTDVLDADNRRCFQPAPSSWPAFEAIDGVKAYYFRNVSNSLAYHMQLFMPAGARRWAARHAAEFDILHLHGHRHLLNSALARAARKHGVPYILAANGTAPPIERRFLLKRLFDPLFGNHVLRGAAHFVAVSECEIEQYASLGVDRARISVIYNGIDLASFKAVPARGAFRRKHGLGGRKIILYLGKITPRKGIEVLVRSYAELLRAGRLKRDDSALIIAGNDMGYRAALERQIASSGIGDAARFTGLVTGEEKLACLTDADVCVYASTQEIFGLVPFEALMCGTPVIVSDDCGCGEVVGRAQAGKLVKYGDADGLAQAITETLAMPAGEKADVIARGRRFVAENLAYEKIAREYVEVYRKVLSGRPEPGHPK
jgi:glycosyltransferase involved in cell wall biosynthesis